jgi:ribosomal protein L11 methyltransferase
VVDLGTGSGLLAIAAALRGASWVVAVDKDRLALENARRNVEENGLAQRVALVESDLKAMPGRPWADLVIANLDRDHFLLSSANLARWLAPGKSMVASGVLDEHEGLVLGAFQEAGLEVKERVRESSWVAFVLDRPRT